MKVKPPLVKFPVYVILVNW